MSAYLEQFERVKRFLKRIENQDRDSTDYDDDLWSFFQNCHHLKDWIKNDPNIEGAEDEVEEFVKSQEDLKICRDLAVRSKHLDLWPMPNGFNAEVISRHVNIYAPVAGSREVGTSTRECIIALEGRPTRIALDVAGKAVEAWRKFLSDKYLI